MRGATSCLAVASDEPPAGEKTNAHQGEGESARLRNGEGQQRAKARRAEAAGVRKVADCAICGVHPQIQECARDSIVREVGRQVEAEDRVPTVAAAEAKGPKADVRHA